MRVPAPIKSILITGASTGIGRESAMHMAGRDWRVFAGVRTQRDAETLGALHENIEPVALDVTDAQQIEAVRAFISDRTDGTLGGLVNNAGIAVGGPVELVPVERLRLQMEVNTIGQIAVTRAMLPMVRAARGRIIAMSSISGRLTLPLYGPYSASKFALEALHDALRMELRRDGIRVSIIEPGSIATPIWDKSIASADAMYASLPSSQTGNYEQIIQVVRERSVDAGQRGIPAARVARVVERAMTSRRPKTRYVIGRDARAMRMLRRILTDRLFDTFAVRALGIADLLREEQQGS